MAGMVGWTNSARRPGSPSPISQAARPRKYRRARRSPSADMAGSSGRGGASGTRDRLSLDEAEQGARHGIFRDGDAHQDVKVVAVAGLDQLSLVALRAQGPAKNTGRSLVA